jgi:[ribosomal protein S5]-alanine N-acetyltransferase
MKEPCFLRGKRIILRPLLAKDLNENYISWINDPKINAFSQRRLYPTSEFQARDYQSKLKPNENILAICLQAKQKHIGNIKFDLNWVNKSAEIMILMGDKTEYGKGYATEAVYLIIKHIFKTLNFNRIEAGSINTGFIKLAKKLGWQEEGVFRKAFFYGEEFKDVTRLSILNSEFEQFSEYESLGEA